MIETTLIVRPKNVDGETVKMSGTNGQRRDNNSPAANVWAIAVNEQNQEQITPTKTLALMKIPEYHYQKAKRAVL